MESVVDFAAEARAPLLPASPPLHPSPPQPADTVEDEEIRPWQSDQNFVSPEGSDPPKPSAKPSAETKQRLASLDIFRGLTVALMILVDDAGGAFPSINHSPWFGVTLADFVMPLFLFGVGVSVALVFKKVPDKVTASKKVILRTINLFLLGEGKKTPFLFPCFLCRSPAAAHYNHFRCQEGPCISVQLCRGSEMGQGLSCASSGYEHYFFAAVQSGDVEAVDSAFRQDPSLLHRHTVYERLSALHIAAANGRLEVLSMILDRSVNPDLLNRHKQTPLMLAAMHGKIACVQKLLEAGANILMFDSLNGRTCLHHAAYHGHKNCLKAILSAAQSTTVADSWGFARFVNVRDGYGATPLHLAARQKHADCLHVLLDNGALVCASTGGYGYPGSTPLHLAARGGSLECVRELLAWGADRIQRDSSGKIPYTVALKRKHGACAALLNPSAAEPLVWPSPLKFISELDPEAKSLLETALADANRQREAKILKGTSYSLPSTEHSDEAIDEYCSEEDDTELCSICFEQVCTIQVQSCGHQMCAHCILALCCHNKPNPTTLCLPSPSCPFCRSDISRLVVAKMEAKDDIDKSPTSKIRRSRRSMNLSEDSSSSFKGLSSAMGSFGKVGRGSGRVADSYDMVDKQLAQ